MQVLIYSACILFQNIIQAVTFRQSCSIEIVELPVFSVVQKKFELLQGVYQGPFRTGQQLRRKLE